MGCRCASRPHQTRRRHSPGLGIVLLEVTAPLALAGAASPRGHGRFTPLRVYQRLALIVLAGRRLCVYSRSQGAGILGDERPLVGADYPVSSTGGPGARQWRAPQSVSGSLPPAHGTGPPPVFRPHILPMGQMQRWTLAPAQPRHGPGDTTISASRPPHTRPFANCPQHSRDTQATRPFSLADGGSRHILAVRAHAHLRASLAPKRRSTGTDGLMA